MHAVHHTESFVIKSVPVGEANRLVWLYTKEFGLAIAAAQGVRKSGAKLQSQIVEYAFISADLVRGREVWRLVSASVREHPVSAHLRAPRTRAYVRTLSALARFLAPEEPNPGLFSHLCQCMECVADESVDPKYLDTLSLWRVLVMLGYIAVDAADQALFEMPLAEAVRTLDEAGERRLRESAAQAIRESHL